MQDTSQVNPMRLQNIYSDILNFKFVRSAGSTASAPMTADDLSMLEQMINMAQPTSRYESCYRKTIYFMYRRDKRGFMEFLRKNKMEHFVLWTDAMNIVHSLSLRDKVYIRWKKRQKIV